MAGVLHEPGLRQGFTGECRPGIRGDEPAHLRLLEARGDQQRQEVGQQVGVARPAVRAQLSAHEGVVRQQDLCAEPGPDQRDDVVAVLRRS